jgi:hypothetical protein
MKVKIRTTGQRQVEKMTGNEHRKTEMLHSIGYCRVWLTGSLQWAKSFRNYLIRQTSYSQHVMQHEVLLPWSSLTVIPFYLEPDEFGPHLLIPVLQYPSSRFPPIYGFISQVEPIISCCMRFLTLTLATWPIKANLFDFINLMKQSIAYIDSMHHTCKIYIQTYKN